LKRDIDIIQLEVADRQYKDALFKNCTHQQ
jgi:hypothetical protein